VTGEEADGFLSNSSIDARPKKRRRRLQPWEIQEMLEKGVERMRKDGVPLIREIEGEINARVLGEEPKPALLSKELRQKEL